MSGGVEMGLDKEVEKLEDREPANAANREVAAISRLVFEPRRFAMLNLLSGGGKADYPFLQRMTDLSMGALATYLRKNGERRVDRGPQGVRIPEAKDLRSD